MKIRLNVDSNLRQIDVDFMSVCRKKHMAYKCIILERVKGYGQHSFWCKLLFYYLYGNM